MSDAGLDGRGWFGSGPFGRDALRPADSVGAAARGSGGVAAVQPFRALAWASLLPLALALHPYIGLVQDARIYVGRGLADRDPAGVGRDILFSHDGQTGFSLMRGLVDAALRVASPGAASMALAGAGEALWLLGAAALIRNLVPGRTGWAAVVCAIVLPTTYGAWGVFNYLEAIATPRLFAEAAVLGALTALLAGRRPLGAALLALALAFHPLMTLPGLAIAGALLVGEDRRWLLAAGAGAVALLAAAALGLHPVDGLFRSPDVAWLSSLRQRSAYLFPGLWPAEAFGPLLCQAAAIAVAALLGPPRVRAVLLAVFGVAAFGLGAAWLFGDVLADTLVLQLQLWRWLWPFALLGNASMAFAAVALWRRGGTARVVLAILVAGRLSSDSLPVAAVLSAAALGSLAVLLRGAAMSVSRLLVGCAAAVAAGLAVLDVGAAAYAMLVLARAARAEGGEVTWPMIVGLGLQRVPLAAAALAVALAPPLRRTWPTASGAAVGLVSLLAAAAWLWDGRSEERRFFERQGADPALQAAVGGGRGEVLWIDENSEVWFLLGRPAFLNSAQAGPILFSRDLAVEWAARAARLLELGLVRPEDVAPWGTIRRGGEALAPTAEAVAGFCADPRGPAAVVAPGDQRGAVPPGAAGLLWRAPVPLRRIVTDDGRVHWRIVEAFTVIRCRGA